MNTPLALEEPALGANRIGGAYWLSPRSSPLLTVVLNRPAAVTWEILADDGQVLASGEERGGTEYEVPLDELTQLRGGQAYSGTIRVSADDQAFVAHARDSGRGRAEAAIEFVYSDDAPEFGARLLRGAGLSPAELVEGDTAFTDSSVVTLQYVRESEAPVRVEVRCSPPGGAQDAAVLGPVHLVDPAQDTAEFELCLLYTSPSPRD